jgi:hypothetical protein
VIVVRTKAGLTWKLIALDQVEVTSPFDGRHGFAVDDISEVIVDSRGGEVVLADDRLPDGTELRAVSVKDAETGIPVRLIFPLEDGRKVGEMLHEPVLWTPPGSR